MYFGKSDGAEAAQLPSVISLPKSLACIEHISSAPELAGMPGKLSAGITAKRDLLFPAISVPFEPDTSSVML